jgi:hypothetical protein
MTRKTGLLSAVIYSGASILIVGIFLALTATRHYTLVARIGGAVWVFILSMIILMPLVTSYLKRKYRQNPQ